MKRLLYIPIVHNQSDMGSLGNTLSKEGGGKYGSAVWQDHIEQVDQSWYKIETEITNRIIKISPLTTSLPAILLCSPSLITRALGLDKSLNASKVFSVFLS